jgi:hypothetical protein
MIMESPRGLFSSQPCSEPLFNPSLEKTCGWIHLADGAVAPHLGIVGIVIVADSGLQQVHSGAHRWKLFQE